MSGWNLAKYEIFAHRGYYGDNSMEGFQACADKGFFIETDVVQTGSGTLYMQHDRFLTYNGESVHISTLTDEQYLSVVGEDAVTLDAFLTWLQQYPDMRVMCDFYLGADEALAKIKASGTMHQWIMNVSSIGSYYKLTYPKLSYCYTGSVSDEAELDVMRTDTNIVTSFVGDETNHNMVTCGGYVGVTVDNVEDYIALGYTWFQPQSSGTALDALQAKLKEYTAPGYKQKVILAHIADAIRDKYKKTGVISARNFPAQIRQLPTTVGMETASALNWKVVTGSAYNMSNIKGDWTQFSEINLDMNGLALSIPGIAYCSFNPAGCIINISNCASATIPGDMLRSANCIKELNFIGGVYPVGTLTRFGQGCNGANDISGVYTSGLTVTGIYLDNITGFNNFLSGAQAPVNIVWEGTLNASVSISTAASLTKDSVNRLISCLADYSGGEAHTLTLGSTLLAKVTNESLSIAAGKNWTLA